jgi:hypothetical protein
LISDSIPTHSTDGVIKPLGQRGVRLNRLSRAVFEDDE